MRVIHRWRVNGGVRESGKKKTRTDSQIGLVHPDWRSDFSSQRVNQHFVLVELEHN
jgi:hypothetical protein